jgi:dTDP-L-rhamnose 4-epimerase
MRMLVTGGEGFIGSLLTKRLVKEGHNVTVLDNLTQQVHGRKHKTNSADYEFVLGDVRDVNVVSRVMRDVDVIYHLAAETGVGQSQYEIERYVGTNTLGTAVVLQAAANCGVRQVVITSSRAVYGEGLHECPVCRKSFMPGSRSREDLLNGNWEISCSLCGGIANPLFMREDTPLKPVSIYGLTKLQQEQVAEQIQNIHHLAITNLRLFNVFGPGQSLNNPYVGVLGTFFRRIRSGQEIDIYEDGQMRRDFVYVGDVVEALSFVGGNEKTFNKTFNVGTGNAVTLEQAAIEMFNLLKSEPKMNFSGKYRLGDIHHAVADTSLCRSLLNYVPETSFADGLRSFVSWALEQNCYESDIDRVAEQLLKEHNVLGEVNV